MGHCQETGTEGECLIVKRWFIDICEEICLLSFLITLPCRSLSSENVSVLSDLIAKQGKEVFKPTSNLKATIMYYS